MVQPEGAPESLVKNEDEEKEEKHHGNTGAHYHKKCAYERASTWGFHWTELSKSYLRSEKGLNREILSFELWFVI